MPRARTACELKFRNHLFPLALAWSMKAIAASVHNSPTALLSHPRPVRLLKPVSLRFSGSEQDMELSAQKPKRSVPAAHDDDTPTIAYTNEC